MVSPANTTLELIKCSTKCWQEAYKSLKLNQSRYKKNYDRCVRFVVIFRVGSMVFLDRPPLTAQLQNVSPQNCIESYYLVNKGLIVCSSKTNIPYVLFRMVWKTRSSIIEPPLAPLQGTIATMNHPTRRNFPVRKNPVWTGNLTRTKEDS